MFRSVVFAVSLACMPLAAKGHEFWIDPIEFEVPPSATVVADLRVGTNFKGAAQAYLPQFRRFEFGANGTTSKMPGRVGDVPAIKLRTNGEGLLVLIHASGDFKIVWDEWQRFVDFVIHKDAEWTLAEHEARGLTKEGVSEAYSRYAKSLVAVGHGKGADFEVGLETEIVALENPYTGNMADGMDLRVLYQGAPRVGEQVEVYEKAPGGEVNVFTRKTDSSGEVTVPVKPGHRYMIDSVVLRVPSDSLRERQSVMWESLWANLTFAVPSN